MLHCWLSAPAQLTNMIGAPSFDHDAGRVEIRFGAANGLSMRVQSLVAPAARERFGWSVAAAGDVDRDGYADVIVGAYEHDGGDGCGAVAEGDHPGRAAFGVGRRGGGEGGAEVEAEDVRHGRLMSG